MAACLLALRKYSIENEYDGITTNVASKFFQNYLKACGFRKLGPVRATIFFLQADYIPDDSLPENFWLQLPIDRDCFDY
jgi:hypothetical protein